MSTLKTLVAILAAAAIASASPLGRPDPGQFVRGKAAGPQTGDKIVGALKSVSASVQQLDISIRTLSAADAGSVGQLMASAEASQKTIEDAAAQVREADDLTLVAAKRLEEPGDELVKQVRVAVADLAAKKVAMDQVGVSVAAVVALRKQQAAASGLQDAVISKIPRLGQAIAKEKFATINSLLSGAVVDLSVPAAAPPPAAVPAPVAPAPVVPAPVVPAPVVPVPAVPEPAASAVPASPAPAQPALAQPATRQTPARQIQA